MNTTVYKQTDKRWASLPFPGGGSTIAGCGCGCLSVTHVLMEVPKYAHYTPKEVQPYMRKWAVRNQGLNHVGISDSLKHFGMDVIFVSESDPMDKAWKYLDKGSYKSGVLLFYSKKGPDGTVWTGGGHFIAFTAYKKIGKKHWLYLKDSGLRASRHTNIKGKKVTESHSGWWCYEDSMKGDVPKLWLAKFSGGKIEKKPPKTKNQIINDTAISLAWPIGTEASKYAYKGGKPTKACSAAINRYFPKANKSGCHVNAFTVLAKAGYPVASSLTWSHIFKYLRKNFTEIKANHTEAQFKEGDIFAYERKDKKGKKYRHICFIVNVKGKLVIAEARQGKAYFYINKSLKKALKTYNVGSWIYRAK